MKQEDKELLLKDLCARLLYRPNVCLSGKETCILTGIDGDEVYLNVDSEPFHVESIKPYLRPMSSMTEKERKAYERFSRCSIGLAPILMDWIYSHHLDCCELIPKGLALEAKEGMYNLKGK